MYHPNPAVVRPANPVSAVHITVRDTTIIIIAAVLKMLHIALLL